jgi:hypothetical protein
MNKVSSALTRKFGPLPAWAWATIIFAGIYYYRKKLGGGTVSGTGTGSVTPTPTTPQPGTVLQPGESLYDPNTGALTTAPGSTSSGDAGSVPPDNSGLVDAITAAIAAGEAAAAGSGGTGSGGGSTGGAGTPPPPRRGAAAKAPKLGRGAVRAPFGPRKPQAPKGYTSRGQGRGFWEFVPKRAPKPKAQHGGKPGQTTKPPKPGTKTKPRSNSNLRHTTGGRTAPVGAKLTTLRGRIRGGAKPNASMARTVSTRRTAPLVTRPVVRQRPVASAQPRAQSVQPSVHRVASTPPRTARTPAPAKPAPRPTARAKRR